MMLSFKNNLKAARIKKGLTQKEVATLLGIATNTYTNYELGNREPDVERIKKLSNIFGISPNDLLGADFNTKITDDAQLQDYLDELKNREEMRMLFSLAKNATKEDIEQAVKIIEALRKDD